MMAWIAANGRSRSATTTAPERTSGRPRSDAAYTNTHRSSISAARSLIISAPSRSLGGTVNATRA